MMARAFSLDLFPHTESSVIKLGPFVTLEKSIKFIQERAFEALLLSENC